MARRPEQPPVSPTRFFRDGLDWQGRTGQSSFAALLLLLLGLFSLWRLGPLVVPGWQRWHEALAALPLIVLLVPAMGHVYRRLNDLGWGGWWAAALALPGVRWAFLFLLLVMPTTHRRHRTSAGWRLLGLMAAGVVALTLAGSLVWTTARVQAQGMKPSLLPGDIALVRRGPIEVASGDVLAFRLRGEDAPRVARVVGLGGDRVAVEGGIPVLGGAKAGRTEDGFYSEFFDRQGPLGVMPVCGNGAVGLGAECLTRRFVETLPGGRAYPVLEAGLRPLDDHREVEVPEGFLFVLGDHRDAAEDSRLARQVKGTGLVALRQVVGRVDAVLWSSDAAWAWDPRGWRPGRILETLP